VAVLVTSRERLGIAAETLLPLEGMSLSPQEGEGSTSDAVRLFVSCAGRVRPAFSPDAEEVAAIGRICAVVQGIPLAIELAAGWIRILSCQEIAREISRDLEFLDTARPSGAERPRTLRHVFDSTWTYMDGDERRVFSRLAVFRGGFSRDAAERVTGAGLGVLRELADRALLAPAGGRFEILEVLRQYAEERLGADPRADEEVRGRHARYYLALLARAEENAGGARFEEALRAVEADHRNVGQAWQWLAEAGDHEGIAEGVEGMFLLYKSRGRTQEGEEAFASALAALRRAAKAAERRGGSDGARIEAVSGRVLIRHGVFCAEMGLYETAREELSAALRSVRGGAGGPGADAEAALALHTLGRIAFHTGEYGEAGLREDEALAIYRGLGMPLGAANALTGLGNCALAVGDTARATGLYRDSVAAGRAAGDRLVQLAPLCNLGIIAAHDGRYAEAIQRFEESLAIARDVGNRQMEANLLTNLARAMLDAGDPVRAETLLHECVALCTDLGLRRFLPFCWATLGTAQARIGNAAAARAHHLRALEGAVGLGERPLVMEIVQELATAAWRIDRDVAGAAELCGLVEASPAADDHVRQRAGALLDEISAGAETPLVESAAARGRLEDPDEAVRRLLASAAGLTVGT
jgi:predicted ATPase